LEIRNDPLECVLAQHRTAALGEIRERDRLVAPALEDELRHALCPFPERSREVEARVLCKTAEQLVVELVAPVPAFDCARRERKLREGDHALRVEEADRAQAVAARASAHRAVEREKARLELGQRIVADGARELRRKQMLPRFL